jgi:hypothetical protein
VKITASSAEYTTTTAGAAVPGGEVLIESEWAEHDGGNVVDDQTVWGG